MPAAQGERLRQKIGTIVLKGGDVLLLDTGEWEQVQPCISRRACMHVRDARRAQGGAEL